MDKLVKVFEVIANVDGQEAVLPIRVPAGTGKYTWSGSLLLTPKQEVIEFLVAAGLYGERACYCLSGNRHVFLNEPIPPATGPVFQEHSDGRVTAWRQ